jgi:DNA-binding transcriptional ArsR family regulator
MSGIVRHISPVSGPVYSSRIVKRVAPPSGVSVNVRSPLKRPSGMPPVQVILSSGLSSVTFTGNARFGLTSEVTFSLAPGSIRPSSCFTLESQDVYAGASVRIAQIAPGSASISAVDSKWCIGNLQVTMPLAADALEALGDANRRAIVELLRAGDRSVGELAGELPISRPAVSRHLRLLKQAGLVSDRAEGTRRLYRLDDTGAAVVRDYLEGLWGEAAARFRLLAENTPERRP